MCDDDGDGWRGGGGGGGVDGFDDALLSFSAQCVLHVCIQMVTSIIYFMYECV